MSGVALRDVTLPNGEIMEDVPVGTTDAQLADQILSRGIADAATLQSWGMVGGVKPSPSPQPGVALPEAPQTDDERVAQWERENMGMARGWEGTKADAASVWDATKNNLDIPAGIAGAFGGAKFLGGVGTAIAPGAGTLAGAAIGTIGGGMIGTFGGSIVSDMLAGDDIDTDAALDLALTSGAIDAATLGLAKGFKPLGNWMGFNMDELGRVFEKFMNPAATDSVSKVGSKESLRATQDLLQEGAIDPATGARIQSSLTAFQTGEASTIRHISEGIGEVGIISSGRYGKQMEQGVVILQQKLDGLMTEALSEVATKGEVGAAMYGVVEAGRKANSAAYTAAMVDARKDIGDGVINPKLIKSVLEKFRDGKGFSFGSSANPKAMALVDDWIKRFSMPGKIPAKDLIDFQVLMNDTISELGEFGSSGASGPAKQQISELSKLVRTRIGKVLNGASPKGAAKVRSANEAYGEGGDQILPSLNANIITKGVKEDYTAIATMLEGTNPDKIAKFMKSVDASFVQAEMAGVDMLKETGFKSAQDIKDVMHDSFITSIFEGIDPAKIALKFEKRKFSESAIAVLGPAKFAQVKRLANGFRDIATVSPSNVGSLVIRAKEAQALSGVVQGGLGLGGAGLSGGLSLSVFVIPSMLAKWASKPASVTYLLSAQREIAKLHKQALKSPVRRLAVLNAAADLTAKASEKLWSDLSEEEQVEIRNSFRGLDNTPVGPNTLHTLDAQQKAQQQAQQGG